MQYETVSSRKESSSSTRKDICQQVTDSIVKLLESGVKPWARPWTSISTPSMPLRHGGERYRGINIMILWTAQHECAYQSPFWMTYRQAEELGGQVQKGERATRVVYYGKAAKEEEEQNGEGERFYRFLKTFAVFNAGQIDNLPSRYYREAVVVTPAGERVAELDSLIADTGATIKHGGNRAFYRPSTDSIQVPDFGQFKTPAYYYSTLFHELAHWTKAPHRLNRNMGSKRWGDTGYAREELVAELASAFMGAEFGFAPEHIEDHASYLASWLKELRDDKRLIFSAAAKAQAAVDFIVRTADLAAART